MNGRVLIGFIDLAVSTITSTLKMDIRIDYEKMEMYENLFHNKWKKLYLGIKINWNFEFTIGRFYFEVKSAYGSFGELMRELKTYKTFIPEDHLPLKEDPYINNEFLEEESFYYVVGPKNEEIPDFSDVLKEQGFNFIECPEDLLEEIQTEKNKQYQSLNSAVRDILKRLKKLESIVYKKPSKSNLLGYVNNKN